MKLYKKKLKMKKNSMVIARYVANYNSLNISGPGLTPGQDQHIVI